jgi:hypothetical protein
MACPSFNGVTEDFDVRRGKKAIDSQEALLWPTDNFTVVVCARNLYGVGKALPASIVLTEPAVFGLNVGEHVPN